MIINGKDTSSLKNIATGTDSLTIDGVATSSKKAVNIGKQSSATADYTVAIGNALASKKYATAVGGALEGYTTTASGQNSTAIGGGAVASGQNSTAIGDRSVSASHLTIAIGSEANAQNGICVGSKSSSNGSCSVSLGTLAVTNANYAIQIGRGSNTTANTLNVGLNENNNYTLLESDGTIPNARLKNTVLINTATGTDSITVNGVIASNDRGINIGKSSIVSYGAVALGYQAQANSANGVALGYNANSNGVRSSAIGYGAITTAAHSIQLGYGTNATADTLSVGFYDETTPVNSKNYTLLQSDGTIPVSRMKNLRLSDIAIADGLVNFSCPCINIRKTGDNIIETSAGVVSNLSPTNYLIYDNPVDLQRNFDIIVKVNTGTLLTEKNNWIMGSTTDTTRHFLFGIVGTTKKSRIYLSSNGTTWDIASSINGTATYSDNTDYMFKLSFNGSTYKLYYSTNDGETWTEDISVTNSNYLATEPFQFGVNESQSTYWPGSIDLSKSNIYSNGEIIWQGYYTDKTKISIPSGYLKNTATAKNSLTINGTVGEYESSTNIGYGSLAYYYATAYGFAASAGGQSMAIGARARGNGTSAVAIGNAYSTTYRTDASGNYAIAIGYNAKTNANSAIQLGNGTNANASTFQVFTYQMLDSTGKIPGARMSLQDASAPTTSTVGSVGQFYVDTTNQDAYICVKADTSTPEYIWKKITV